MDACEGDPVVHFCQVCHSSSFFEVVVFLLLGEIFLIDFFLKFTLFWFLPHLLLVDIFESIFFLFFSELSMLIFCHEGAECFFIHSMDRLFDFMALLLFHFPFAIAFLQVVEPDAFQSVLTHWTDFVLLSTGEQKVHCKYNKNYLENGLIPLLIHHLHLKPLLNPSMFIRVDRGESGYFFFPYTTASAPSSCFCKLSLLSFLYQLIPTFWSVCHCSNVLTLLKLIFLGSLPLECVYFRLLSRFSLTLVYICWLIRVDLRFLIC